MNIVFFEDVYQIYLADGNLHILCSNSTGEIDHNGNDKLHVSAKLIIPSAKAKIFLPRLLEAVSEFSTSEYNEAPPIGQTQEEPIKEVTLGSPIEFYIR
jgi:hypothetical protein